MPRKPRVALVCPSDEASVYVVERCLTNHLASFTLIDHAPCNATLASLIELHPGEAEFIETSDADAAAALGVELVRGHRADVLMKGIINTDNLMRAVLNKEHGLLIPGAVLSHIAMAETPTYGKLLMFSDATVIPAPTLQQFEAMITYDVALAHALGVTEPKVALIHFTEKTNPRFPVTTDYAELRRKCAEGIFGNAMIDGPMDVKTAVDAHSSAVKGIHSPVCGDADILIMPDLEAANTFYKTLSCFAGATIAGMISGATAPVVLPSRADSPESKFYSLALACVSVAR